MKKIKSLFMRSFENDRKVYNEITKGAEWVQQGEGIATRKWDGQAVLIKDGQIYLRYDAKKGRTPPEDFIPAQPQPDPVSLHWPGWVKPGKGQDKYVKEALTRFPDGMPEDGTYELCGPKIGTRHGANPENLEHHVLIKHGVDVLDDCPTDYHSVRAYLKERSIEGIVWHNPTTGDMVKIKKNDFPL